MRFTVGDIVEWNSQAAGIPKTKRGEIEAIIPAGSRPNIKGVGWQRDHESYVVRVRNAEVSRLYWPRVSHLRMVRP